MLVAFLFLSIFYLIHSKTVVAFDCQNITDLLKCNGTITNWLLQPESIFVNVTNLTVVNEQFFIGKIYNTSQVRVDCFSYGNSFLKNCYMKSIIKSNSSSYSIYDKTKKCMTPQDPIFQNIPVCNCTIPMPDAAPQYSSYGKLMYSNCFDHNINQINIANCYSIEELDPSSFYCMTYFLKNYEFSA